MLHKLAAVGGRLGRVLALALAFAVAATMLVTGMSAALERPAGPAATVAAAASSTDPPQCYSWDVANNTGLDADGLSAQFDGVIAVTDVYTGAANALGEPRPQSGYDATNDRYTLLLGANATTVAAGDVVRVGFCSPTPATFATMTWLSGTVGIEPASIPPVLTWHWQSPGQLDVAVHNTTGAAATLLGLDMLLPEAPITVDDLDPAIVSSLNLAAAGLDEPAALASSEVLTRSLTFGALQAGDPVVLALQWSTDEDLANASTAYVATTVPGWLYLPNVKRSGP